MDILSDVLSNLRLRAQMYFRTEFAGTWGVALPTDRDTIRFHLVVQGQCWVTVAGHPSPLCLREGDFALVPHGAAQTLANSPDSNSDSLDSLISTGAIGGDGIFRHGDGESNRQTRLVCGFCSFDAGLVHPLVLGLPPVIVMGRRTTASSPWIAEVVRVMTMEADLDGMGGTTVMSRLMEVLFIHSIRHYCESQLDPRIPYLIAISDNKLKFAIEAMHEHPGREWSLTQLAKLTSMSRGRFAKRFKDVLGQSPMQYLAEWRLQKARHMLKETNLSISEVAFRSGYQSLPSFTRRFGKQFSITPAAYRKEKG